MQNYCLYTIEPKEQLRPVRCGLYSCFAGIAVVNSIVIMDLTSGEWKWNKKYFVNNNCILSHNNIVTPRFISYDFRHF